MTADERYEAATRRYHEAHLAYRLKQAEEIANLAEVRDADVRASKALLACRAEAEELSAAVADLDALSAGNTERWIAAHETLSFVRASQRES